MENRPTHRGLTNQAIFPLKSEVTQTILPRKRKSVKSKSQKYYYIYLKKVTTNPKCLEKTLWFLNSNLKNS